MECAAGRAEVRPGGSGEPISGSTSVGLRGAVGLTGECRERDPEDTDDGTAVGLRRSPVGGGNFPMEPAERLKRFGEDDEAPVAWVGGPRGGAGRAAELDRGLEARGGGTGVVL